MGDPLRIGNAGGYWGDDLTVLKRQVEDGPIDVVTLDFLAEITMSILQKQRSRDPSTGFARDFVDQMRQVMASAVAMDVSIITNAGGVNPRGCRDALLTIADEQNLSVRVGLVAGDDVLARLDGWHDEAVDLSNMDTGQPFGDVQGRITSANAYFGADPVVTALTMGAQFIVTGRVTDTGITLAPMIHRFGWKLDDYDRLAAGIVAGHILECGAQSTGGNFTDWRQVENFDQIGYPIVEMHEDGSFVVTKHEGSGGLVSVETVKEQLLYEMGDPFSYLTPDVVASFASIRVEQDGPDRVRVWGIRGAPPTNFLKISASYSDGFKAAGSVIISGPEAREKAECFAEILWDRLPAYEESLTEYVGADATWGPISPSTQANELLLRFGVRDHDREAIGQFSKMLPALILSGPPGVAVTGGRPPIQNVAAYWPCLIPRSLCSAQIEVSDGASIEIQEVVFGESDGNGRCDAPVLGLAGSADAATNATDTEANTATVTVPLRRIAHGRSGDKGDTCNIGIIARHPVVYPWLVENLSAARVKERFAGICKGEVERFEVANLGALNFLLHECLGGGGTLSLHIDAQGKTLSHALLAMEVRVEAGLLEQVEESRA